MIRIEIISEEKVVRANVMVEGKGDDIVNEVLVFHRDHMDMLKEITDKLPPNAKLKVLLGLLQDHFELSKEGSDKD